MLDFLTETFENCKETNQEARKYPVPRNGQEKKQETFCIVLIMCYFYYQFSN